MPTTRAMSCSLRGWNPVRSSNRSPITTLAAAERSSPSHTATKSVRLTPVDERRPMNARAKITTGHSACPHDCPSTCALDVELLPNGEIGRVRGAEDNSYTAGVICAKVARYAERVHHPDRLTYPLRRKGPKGSSEYQRISWDDALDLTAEAMLRAEARYGPEAVWPTTTPAPWAS